LVPLLPYGAGETDLWLVKTDSEGNMVWNKTYGGEYYDEGWMVLETSDGGCLIAGTTCNMDMIGNAWLVKTDSVGTLERQKPMVEVVTVVCMV
jgi:hypothetical protein